MSEKEYKYKLETKDDIKNVRNIYSDAGRQNREVKVGKEMRSLETYFRRKKKGLQKD